MKTQKSSRNRSLRIGVASYEEMKARSIAIARGEVTPAPDEPKIWVTSAELAKKVRTGKVPQQLRPLLGTE
jgi:hypothetical protein